MDKAGCSQGPFEEKLGFICRIRETLAALQSSFSCKCCQDHDLSRTITRNQCHCEQAAQPSAQTLLGTGWALISTDTEPRWGYPSWNSINGQQDLLWPHPDAGQGLPQSCDQVSFKRGQGWAEAHPWCWTQRLASGGEKKQPLPSAENKRQSGERCRVSLMEQGGAD